MPEVLLNIFLMAECDLEETVQPHGQQERTLPVARARRFDMLQSLN